MTLKSPLIAIKAEGGAEFPLTCLRLSGFAAAMPRRESDAGESQRLGIRSTDGACLWIQARATHRRLSDVAFAFVQLDGEKRMRLIAQLHESFASTPPSLLPNQGENVRSFLAQGDALAPVAIDRLCPTAARVHSSTAFDRDEPARLFVKAGGKGVAPEFCSCLVAIRADKEDQELLKLEFETPGMEFRSLVQRLILI